MVDMSNISWVDLDLIDMITDDRSHCTNGSDPFILAFTEADDRSSFRRRVPNSYSELITPNYNPHEVYKSRYKTELCRPFTETGTCKYGNRCQFAHGTIELRRLARHPKFKTELCRTFHDNGFCPYGPRCHFIHNLHDGNGFLTSSQSSNSTSPGSWTSTTTRDVSFDASTLQTEEILSIRVRRWFE